MVSSFGIFNIMLSCQKVWIITEFLEKEEDAETGEGAVQLQRGNAQNLFH